MSAAHAAAAGGHDHEHHDDDELGYHATYKGYVVGFMLSVILTAIPFWLVMAKVVPSAKVTGLVILGFAAVQMIVHIVYFLHLDRKSQGGWNMLALVFTAILLFILLSGTIWVMIHMNENMMPMDPQLMRQMP